jgi:hypothetical protein
MEEEDGMKEWKILRRRMEGQVRIGWVRERDGKGIQKEDREERFLMSEGRVVW